MRRKVKNRNIVKPDHIHKSQKVGQLINYTMKNGKKDTARKCVYGAFEIIKEKAQQDPLDVLDLALRNAGPMLEVRSRRIGGATYQVPREVRPERRQAMALRWIMLATRARKGMPMAAKLAEELIAASKNEGEAVKKKENTHKMAEANRAFAHFAW
jgi:small subunit ribosomal protein S7